MVVGITGKSASGKSTVSKYITSLGYRVIDIDVIHKAVAAKYMDKIDAMFPKHGYITQDRRERIRAFFKDEKLRRDINSVSYPEVFETVVLELKNSQDTLVFLDAPLLFEMDLYKLCDKIWYIQCAKEVNIQRLMNRNNLTYDEALERYNAIKFTRNQRAMIDLQLNTQQDTTEIIRKWIQYHAK